MLKFVDSIEGCRGRGSLVINLWVFLIERMDDRASLVLPKLLNTLPNLRFLHLTSSMPSTVRCDTIFTVRMPHLCKFTTDLEIGPDTALFEFLAAHEELEELGLRFTSPPDLPAVTQDRVDAKPFSSLRVLACSSPFLNSRRPVLSNLTHLSRSQYLASEVVQIAAFLGPRLVSLHLCGRIVARVDAGVGPDANAEPRWSLDDVAVKFPRLRFLQVDSPYVSPCLVPR